MQVKIADLMSTEVITCTPHQTVGQVRHMIDDNHIHAVPVVDDSDRPVGMVSAADLMNAASDMVKIKEIMSDKVHSIPAYNGVHQAARLMRKNRVHHAMVIHEKKLVGVLSSFDLLQLVEEHRFVMKNGPK